MREKVPPIADLRGRPTLYAHWLWLRLVGRGTFAFQGRDYRYFHHPYNVTWTNERAVEVPIVRRAIEEAGAAVRLLEVGNVLSHYSHRGHDVVDKYESGTGILNTDIVDFRHSEPYDLIVSISTLEHVGWDEDERDPGKIPRAVEHIRTLLAPSGEAIVTLPLGYNPNLDELVRAGALDVDREYFLLRLAQCQWREVEKAELGRPAYGSPFPGANGLMIGIIQRP